MPSAKAAVPLKANNVSRIVALNIQQPLEQSQVLFVSNLTRPGHVKSRPIEGSTDNRSDTQWTRIATINNFKTERPKEAPYAQLGTASIQFDAWVKYLEEGDAQVAGSTGWGTIRDPRYSYAS